jgi:hypothetical protein
MIAHPLYMCTACNAKFRPDELRFQLVVAADQFGWPDTRDIQVKQSFCLHCGRVGKIVTVGPTEGHIVTVAPQIPDWVKPFLDGKPKDSAIIPVTYELTTPYLRSQIAASEPIIACAAALVLDEGCDVLAMDGSFVMGRHPQTWRQWFRETFADDVAAILRDRAGEVAAALDTICDVNATTVRTAHFAAAFLRKIAKVNNAACK